MATDSDHLAGTQEAWFPSNLEEGAERGASRASRHQTKAQCVSGHLCWSWSHVFIPLSDSRALDWRVFSFTTIGMIFCNVSKTHRENHVFIPTPTHSQHWRCQRGGDCWRGSLRSPEAGSKGRDSVIHPGRKSMEKTAKVSHGPAAPEEALKGCQQVRLRFTRQAEG